MKEKTAKNDAICNQSMQEQLNSLERTCSEYSIKSQIENSTEINEKNCKLDKFKRIILRKKIIKTKKTQLFMKNYQENRSIKKPITRKEKRKEKFIFKECITRFNKTKQKETILDFNRFLEEIYKVEEEGPKKKRNIKKQNKNKQRKKKDSYQVSSLKKNKSLNHIKNAGLYDLDNFLIKSNQSMIIEKKLETKIFIPKFTELNPNFFYLPNFKVSKSVFTSEEIKDEDISDNIYLRYHNIYELREREYRLNYYKRKSSSLKIEKVDYNFDFNNSKIDLKSNIKVNKK